eukprot:UC4_evm4s302
MTRAANVLAAFCSIDTKFVGARTEAYRAVVAVKGVARRLLTADQLSRSEEETLMAREQVRKLADHGHDEEAVRLGRRLDEAQENMDKMCSVESIGAEDGGQGSVVLSSNEVMQLEEAVLTRCIDLLMDLNAERWEKCFGLPKKWKEKHGGRDPSRTVKVRNDDDGEEVNLGTWCDKQRQTKRNGRLSADRISQLDGIGFGWGNTAEEAWERCFGLLKKWKEEHGGKDPSRTVKVRDDDDGEEVNLGPWCNTQRQAKRNGRLSADRISQLDGIGFGWGNTAEEAWEKCFGLLKKWKDEHGGRDPSKTVKVRDDDDGEEVNLGSWCNTQSADRISRLDGIGFGWGEKKKCTAEEYWEKCFGLLEKWKEEHGGRDPSKTVKVRDDDDGEEENLGSWCHKQRQAKRNGNLSADRISRLDGIRFGWGKVS